MAWFRETFWFAVRSFAFCIPPLMICNKLLRGNFMGVPTENDIVPVIFFRPPLATVPRSLEGFAPDDVSRPPREASSTAAVSAERSAKQ